MKQHFLTNTRTDFMDYWQSINGEVETDLNKRIAEINLFHQMSEMTGSVFHLVNIPEQRFETMSSYILDGHKQIDYFQKGFDYTFEQFHPNFLKMGFESFHHIFSTWYTSPPQIRSQIEVYRDFLYHNGNRKNPRYIRIMEKIKPFALDKNDKVSLVFVTAKNISHLKKNENGTMAIKIPDQEVYFYHYDTSCNTMIEYGNFSPQQYIIIKLLANGLSSKDISELLRISSHTVDTHRPNMLQITNCVNTTALIIYSRMCGIV